MYNTQIEAHIIYYTAVFWR